MRWFDMPHWSVSVYLQFQSRFPQAFTNTPLTCQLWYRVLTTKQSPVTPWGYSAALWALGRVSNVSTINMRTGSDSGWLDNIGTLYCYFAKCRPTMHRKMFWLRLGAHFFFPVDKWLLRSLITTSSSVWFPVVVEIVKHSVRCIRVYRLLCPFIIRVIRRTLINPGLLLGYRT
jgi:hypothetical protein